MDAVRAVVRLARSIREDHRIRHRHPLPKVAIAGLAPRVVEANLDLLREELNVKAVEPLADPASLTQRVIKLDYTRLGKKLRGDVKRVQAAVSAGEYQLLDGGARLLAAGIELGPDEFTFRYQTRDEQTGVAAENDLVVLLGLQSTPELVVEGQVRDLNRGVQDLRKQARLAYADRIRLSVVGPAPIIATLEPHFAWIAEQALAVEISRAPLPAPLAESSVDLGEETVQIALARG
jgi:isoleucyl-tRNA synthetase